MKIEIAPRRFHITECTFGDALLYCFSLNVNGKTGWRLPKKIEIKDLPHSGLWLQEDFTEHPLMTWKCVPVRDL